MSEFDELYDFYVPEPRRELSRATKATAFACGATLIGAQTIATYDLLTEGLITPDSDITKGVIILEVGYVSYHMAKHIGSRILDRINLTSRKNLDKRSEEYHARRRERSKLQQGYTAAKAWSEQE